MKKTEKNKEINEKDKKPCSKSNEDSQCHCSEECQCGDNCECGEDCNCGDNCNCGNDCKCNSENEDCKCQCHEEKEDTELLSNRIKELEDGLLRSQAELLNYRKRKDEETARILKYAEEDILKGFLPILDNFERAISMDDNNFGDETSKFIEGFRMVYNQTKKLLEKFEVKEIDCLDKEFDPTYEQAISMEKNEEKPSGTVLKVYQKGYMYKDKVLRLAMVIVNE